MGIFKAKQLIVELES